MKRTTTEHPADRSLASRLGWFVGLWAAGVTVLSGVAYLLRKIILG